MVGKQRGQCNASQAKKKKRNDKEKILYYDADGFEAMYRANGGRMTSKDVMRKLKEQRNVNIMNERERLAEAKLIFEGESCALSYNDDDEWFDDEDEEFAFNVDANICWFEDVFVEGLKERDEMQNTHARMLRRKIDSVSFVILISVMVVCTAALSYWVFFSL
jgi:hypothetical protein